jgi:uncharacterized protein (TIGR03437 family)
VSTRPGLADRLFIKTMRYVKTTLPFLLVLAAFPWRSVAQTYDSTGNGMLNGAYYLRQVIYVIQDSEVPYGTVTEAINTYGNITFDGNGNYSFSGWYLDAANNSVTPVQFTSSGTYVISASGMGYITAVNPEVAATDQMIGLVSNGIFIGSTTQNTEGYNDLVVAAPVGSPLQTNATLNGSYAVAYMDPTFPGDAAFTLNATGQGNIGTVNVTGYTSNNTTAGTESLTGVTYAFTNGAAQLNLGGNTNGSELVAGTELLYISPDGNFIFGGSANGFDFFVGVRAAGSNPTNYNALYYQAGLDLDESAAASDGYVLLDSYYGAINVFSNLSGNNIIGHQSLNDQLVYEGAADYTYYDNYTQNGDGTSTDGDFGQMYWSSSDGTIRIGYGIPDASTGYDVLSINVALQAPTFTGPGVYLDPAGMVNAASSAPFTAHLSPGEFLSLYGTGLAPSAASATALPLPTKLNGVEVSINGVLSPLNYVSPTQISVVVPFATSSVAQIQVNNNGTTSNTVTQFVGSTSAGVFTFQPEGGYGFAAAEDVTSGSNVVTASSPAQIGDTVAVFLAGLGAANGFPVDGAPGSGVAPYNQTVNTPVVYIDDTAGNDTQATVTFSGLAPCCAGLYQINFTVPSGVASGDTVLDISGPDSESVESLLPVGTPSGDAAHAKSAGQRPRIHHHRLARPATVSANQP